MALEHPQSSRGPEEAALPRRRGRPRSPQADRAIMRATLDELIERGFEALTIERVADRAGVGRTTVYRRWPSKGELAHAVTADLARGIAVPDAGSLAGDLDALLRAVVAMITRPPGSRVLPGLLTAMAEHPELRHAGQEFYDHRRQTVFEVLERAARRGEIPSGYDRELAADLLLGPVYYRVLVTGARVTPAYRRQVVGALLRSLGAAT